jgi:enoyl-CoA hydratase/carnithine racemase
MGTVMGDLFNAGAKAAPAAANAPRVLRVEWRERVAVLAMADEVSRNTFSDAMAEQITEALPALRNAACIVLHSDLPSVFHVGANPRAFRAMRGEPKCLIASKVKAFYTAFLELFGLQVPVITVLHGKVFGGGLPIALWSDYRIAAPDVDLHYGNISRGMSPAAQLSEQLQQHLAPGAIMDLYLTNGHWDAARAQREGLVQHVCASKAQALQEALELAAFVATKPSAGIARTLSVVKLDRKPDIVNIEAWLIAESVAAGHVFNEASTSGMDASWAPRNAITMGPAEHFAPAPRAPPAAPPALPGQAGIPPPPHCMPYASSGVLATRP